MQELPYATDDAWYPVTVAPCATDDPLKVHDDGADTWHDGKVYVPERVPLTQVRCSDKHSEPYGTVADGYAGTEAPAATVVPLNAQFAGGGVAEESAAHEAN